MIDEDYLRDTIAYWQTRAERLELLLRSFGEQADQARWASPHPPEPPVGTQVWNNGALNWERRPASGGWFCSNPECENCPCGWDEVWDRAGSRASASVVLPGAASAGAC